MGTFLVLDIPKVPSDSTIWELCKSVFGNFGIKNLSRLDSRDMCTCMAIINDTDVVKYVNLLYFFGVGI